MVRHLRLWLILRGRWLRVSFLCGGGLGRELIRLSHSTFGGRVASFAIIFFAHVPGDAHVTLLTRGRLDGTPGTSDRRVHVTCGLLSLPGYRTIILVALLDSYR